MTISSELAYQRDKNRFYGYPVAIPENITTNNFVKYFNQDQLDQLGYFDLSVKSNAAATSDMKFNTGINLSYFNTSTQQVEKASRFRGDFDYNFGAFNGKLTAGFDHFETENVTELTDLPLFSSSSSWLHLEPSIFYRNDFITLEGGLNLFTVLAVHRETASNLIPKLPSPSIPQKIISPSTPVWMDTCKTTPYQKLQKKTGG